MNQIQRDGHRRMVEGCKDADGYLGGVISPKEVLELLDAADRCEELESELHQRDEWLDKAKARYEIQAKESADLAGKVCNYSKANAAWIETATEATVERDLLLDAIRAWAAAVDAESGQAVAGAKLRALLEASDDQA